VVWIALVLAAVGASAPTPKPTQRCDSISFTETVIAGGLTAGYGVVAFDGDGDGTLDFATAHLAASVTGVPTAAPTYQVGVFAAASGLEGILGETAEAGVAVAVADVDGDGDGDVVAVTDAGTVGWYENGGAWTFTARGVSTSSDGVAAVVAADIDGDGTVDVVAARGAYDEEFVVYLNDGRQSFAANAVARIYNVGVAALFAADVDGDGDLDVLAAWNDAAAVMWYENAGTTVMPEHAISHSGSESCGREAGNSDYRGYPRGIPTDSGYGST